jgi:isocitrate lyase
VTMFDQQVAAAKKWFASPRFAGIVRLYHLLLKARGRARSLHQFSRLLPAHPARHRNRLRRHLQKAVTEPARGEMSPAMHEAIAKTNGGKKMQRVLPAPTGIGAFSSEWY